MTLTIQAGRSQLDISRSLSGNRPKKSDWDGVVKKKTALRAITWRRVTPQGETLTVFRDFKKMWKKGALIHLFAKLVKDVRINVTERWLVFFSKLRWDTRLGEVVRCLSEWRCKWSPKGGCMRFFTNFLARKRWLSKACTCNIICYSHAVSEIKQLYSITMNVPQLLANPFVFWLHFPF